MIDILKNKIYLFIYFLFYLSGNSIYCLVYQFIIFGQVLSFLFFFWPEKRISFNGETHRFERLHPHQKGNEQLSRDSLAQELLSASQIHFRHKP